MISVILVEMCVRIALTTAMLERGYTLKTARKITDDVVRRAKKYHQLTLEAISQVEEGQSLIRRALDHAGYMHLEDTEENLIECFKDYVAAGVWADITLDDVGEITVEQMCLTLLKYRI